MNYICEQEGLKVESESALKALVEISDGDLRKAITFLQSASVTGSVSEKMVRELSGSPNPELIQDFLQKCLGFNLNEIEESTADIVYSGYDLNQTLEILCSLIESTTLIKEELKPELIMRISAADEMITNRADPYLQLLDIASAINASK